MTNLLKNAISFARISRFGLGAIFLGLSSLMVAGVLIWIWQIETGKIHVPNASKEFFQNKLAITPIVDYTLIIGDDVDVRVVVGRGYLVVESEEGEKVISFGQDTNSEVTFLTVIQDVTRLGPGRYKFIQVEGDVAIDMTGLSGKKVKFELIQSSQEVEKKVNELRAPSRLLVVLLGIIFFLVIIFSTFKFIDIVPEEWFDH